MLKKWFSGVLSQHKTLQKDIYKYYYILTFIFMRLKQIHIHDHSATRQAASTSRGWSSHFGCGRYEFWRVQNDIFHYSLSDFYHYIWIGLNLLSIDLLQAQVLLSSTGLGHQQLLYSLLFTDVPYASVNHLLEWAELAHSFHYRATPTKLCLEWNGSKPLPGHYCYFGHQKKYLPLY